MECLILLCKVKSSGWVVIVRIENKHLNELLSMFQLRLERSLPVQARSGRNGTTMTSTCILPTLGTLFVTGVIF